MTTTIRSARRGRWAAGVAGALLTMTLGVAPASATVTDHFRFSQPYGFTSWDCGYELDVAGSESHVVVIRADQSLDGYLFFTDNYAWRETWTAPDGRWFALAANGVAKDVKAKSLGGTLYEFTFHNSGSPLSVIDSSGRVVYRDRGNFSVDYTIDVATGAFNFVGARFSGPHPLADLELCHTVAGLTGPYDSARHLTPRPLGSTSATMGYYEYLPPSYTASGTKSPLIVALNGYGENGDGTPEGLRTRLLQDIPRYIVGNGWPTDRPFVVLAPQHVEQPGFDQSSCDGVPWPGSCGMILHDQLGDVQPAPCTTGREVHDFLSYAVATYNVDPSRVYLVGLSCGGYGVWEYLYQYGNEYVAAAVPIAGDGRPAWNRVGCALASVPIWAFHGALDDIVDPQGSIVPMTSIASCPGATAERDKVTVYSDRDHDSWTPAYTGFEGDDIYGWMLSFTNP